MYCPFIFTAESKAPLGSGERKEREVITPHEADKYDPWGYAGKKIKDYLEEGKGQNAEIIRDC